MTSITEEEKIAYFVSVFKQLRKRGLEQLKEIDGSADEAQHLIKILTTEFWKDIECLIALDKKFVAQHIYIIRSVLEKAVKLNYFTRLKNKRRRKKIALGESLYLLSKMVRALKSIDKKYSTSPPEEQFYLNKGRYHVKLDWHERDFRNKKFLLPYFNKCLYGLSGKKHYKSMYALTSNILHSNHSQIKLCSLVENTLSHNFLIVMNSCGIVINSLDREIGKRTYRSKKIFEKIQKSADFKKYVTR